jgi:transcriptional repressor NrdR
VREVLLAGPGDLHGLAERLGDLRGLDDVAYVRFASVYRNFRETRDFEALIGELEGDEKDPV